MNKDLIYFKTNLIPIFNSKGQKLDEVVLPQVVTPVPRRRCCISNNNTFYKGAGIIYTGHFVNNYNSPLQLLDKTEALYEKYHVIYPSLFQKYGIFTFQHQPVFSDYEGGCGKKEKRLLEMQRVFMYSAIEEIINVIPVPLEDHAIYVYKLKQNKGNYLDTINLIEYILCENYNTAWDKNLWDDISNFGYVRDLADWFVSEEFKHKLGTLYALLNTLLKKDKYTYEAVVHSLTGLEQLNDHHIIFIAATIVKKFSPQCVPNIDLNNLCQSTYFDLWNYLYDGNACCHLEKETEWSYTRDIFKEKIPENISKAMKDLMYHRVMLNR